MGEFNDRSFYYQMKQRCQIEKEVTKEMFYIVCHSVSKVHFWLQKLQILEKLEKWSIFVFVAKLSIFSGAKFEIHLNFRA